MHLIDFRMAKRSAVSELNHDNWYEEDTPEEAGTFCKASPDVMQCRLIKSAKRRSTGQENSGATKNPFAAFGGFKTASTNSAPSFSFLTNMNKPSDTTNGSASKDTTNDSRSQEYYSELTGLNQSVSRWIKSHVDSNPLCILTPIFRDYEHYLDKINEQELKRQHKKGADTTEKKIKSPEKSTPDSSVTECDAAGSTEGVAAESQKPSELVTASTDSTTTVAAATTTTFSFGPASSNGSNMKAGFTFGSSQPFTFSNVTKPDTKPVEKKAIQDDEDEPPKVTFTPVTEEGAVYSKRCKVFLKKDASFQERGVGTLYLKPAGEKMQLIIRADTSLGNVLVNTLLTAGLPLRRMGSNNVMLVCIPTPDVQPPPVPLLIRLKTGDDADEVFNKLKEHIK
jgi:nuclear pore complex protein Nup50